MSARGGIDGFGVAAWAGWLTWALACAVGIRLALVALFKRARPQLSRSDSVVLTYPAMIAIFIVSVTLHFAILGEPQLYGASSWDLFNLSGFLFAPFGLPLAVGLVLLLLFDVLHGIASKITRRLTS